MDITKKAPKCRSKYKATTKYTNRPQYKKL